MDFRNNDGTGRNCELLKTPEAGDEEGDPKRRSVMRTQGWTDGAGAPSRGRQWVAVSGDKGGGLQGAVRG